MAFHPLLCLSFAFAEYFAKSFVRSTPRRTEPLSGICHKGEHKRMQQAERYASRHSRHSRPALRVGAYQNFALLNLPLPARSRRFARTRQGWFVRSFHINSQPAWNCFEWPRKTIDSRVSVGLSLMAERGWEGAEAWKMPMKSLLLGRWF